MNEHIFTEIKKPIFRQIIIINSIKVSSINNPAKQYQQTENITQKTDTALKQIGCCTAKKI